METPTLEKNLAGIAGKNRGPIRSSQPPKELKVQRHIAIEGNIGAGKTTLAKLLAEKLDARLFLEEFAENPFLAAFYKNPERYAFSLEMSFLADRFRQLQQIREPDLFHPITVADHCIEKSLVFAQANLEGQDLNLFKTFYSMVESNAPRPDIIVFLYRSYANLQNNIKQRGRSYEQDISHEYLKEVQAAYLSHLKLERTIPILMIDADQHDFLNKHEHLNKLQKLLAQNFKAGLNFPQ